MLTANKVQPFSEDAWKMQPVQVDFYLLMGVPYELVVVGADQDVNSALLQMTTTLIKVEPLREKPTEFPEIEGPLFYGHIALGEGVGSIKGMSGGPILAFQQMDNGELRYWVTALQSTWLPSSHYIKACYTKLLGDMLENNIQVNQIR